MRKTKKTYEIDGKTYATRSLMLAHEEFKNNKFAKTFKLPEVKDNERRGKYGNFKCEVNGISFDSIMEAKYYLYLKQLEKEKTIKKFERQVKFDLIPKGKTKDGRTYRAITYIADFVLQYKDGDKEIVDVKGKKTPEFKIKEKLFYHFHPDKFFHCIQYDAKTKQWMDLDELEKLKKAQKKGGRKS